MYIFIYVGLVKYVVRAKRDFCTVIYLCLGMCLAISAVPSLAPSGISYSSFRVSTLRSRSREARPT